MLFAKIYDIAPDGTKVLKNRLIAPVRVADVTKPVTSSCPASCTASPRATGSRWSIAASDAAYAGNTLAPAGHGHDRPGLGQHARPAARRQLGFWQPV